MLLFQRQRKPQTNHRGCRFTPTTATSGGSAGIEAVMGLLQVMSSLQLTMSNLPLTIV